MTDRPLTDIQAEYRTRGVVIWEGMVPLADCARFVEEALYMPKYIRDKEAPGMTPSERQLADDAIAQADPQTSRAILAASRGGLYRHAVIDGEAVRDMLPMLHAYYEALTGIMRAVTGQPVVMSPYPKSAVNIKLYPGIGGQQGWHYDSNGLTGLLFLTSHRGTMHEGGLELVPLDTLEPEVYRPQAGDFLVMRGREVEHRVQPMLSGVTRATVPMNYYLEGDTWRPPGQDDLVYGDDETADLDAWTDIGGSL